MYIPSNGRYPPEILSKKKKKKKSFAPNIFTHLLGEHSASLSQRENGTSTHLHVLQKELRVSGLKGHAG